VLFASITSSDIKHVPHLVSVDGVKKIVNGEITMGFFNPADRDRRDQDRQAEGARGHQHDAFAASA
jgi:hypothetical protein